MKKNILLFVVIFSCFQFSMVAQKIKIKKGLVTVNKASYCKIEKEGNLLKKIITISNLNDEELIYIKSLDVQLFYEVNFLNAKQKMTIQQTALTNFNKAFVKKLYKSKLIKEGKIDTSVLDKFILKYSTELPIIPNNPNQTIIINGNTSQFEKVARDTNKPINVYANRIEQDFKTIGTVQSDINTSTFFIGTTNNKIASINFKNNGTISTAVIKTYADNKVRTLSVNFVHRNKEIAKYLVDNDYL